MADNNETKQYLTWEGVQTMIATFCDKIETLWQSVQDTTIAAVETEKNAAIAAVSVVDVQTEENVQYILDNCSEWTEGDEYQLPSGMSITYHANQMYYGGE